MTFLYYLFILVASAVMGTGLAAAVRLRKTAPDGALRRAAGFLLGLVSFFLVGYLVTPFVTPAGHQADYVLVAAIYLAGAVFVLLVLRLIGVLVRQVQGELESLRESEERFRMLFDAATDAIFILGDQGRILNVNRTGYERLGYPKQELLAMRISEIDLPEFAAQVKERTERTIRDGSAVFETAHRRKDGAVMPVEVNARVIEYRGQPAFLSVARDITKRKLAEEALNKAKEDLERQNEELRAVDLMRGGLIRDVSHELKTPVAKHAMQLKILKRIVGHHSLDAAEERAFHVMEKSIRRQQGVIRNLLDLSRLEAGSRGYRRETVRLDQIFERVVEDYRFQIDAHHVAIEVTLPPTEIQSDEEMLWHVFSNLINNAIKFSRHEATPRISISANIGENEVVVRIKDNGIGLATEELALLFTHFYQASATREGTGLGLTICRKIVEGLGGIIELESPGPGEGTTAVVALPLP